VKYKAIIFDLDGTLLNTIEDLQNSMNAVLAKFGFPTHDLETFKTFIGTGVTDLVKYSLPPENRDKDTIDKCIDAMRYEYSKRWDNKTRPYKGIPQLLDALTNRNIKMAILSNKPHIATKQVVSKLLPQWKFEAVFGERPPIPRKPDPTSALEIADLLGIKPSEFLYLGDSGTDMQTANAAGMYAVGALWGFRDADDLLQNGAKKIIGKPEELLELL
jgi:phosphoglycolate phosphatase